MNTYSPSQQGNQAGHMLAVPDNPTLPCASHPRLATMSPDPRSTPPMNAACITHAKATDAEVHCGAWELSPEQDTAGCCQRPICMFLAARFVFCELKLHALLQRTAQSAYLVRCQQDETRTCEQLAGRHGGCLRSSCTATHTPHGCQRAQIMFNSMASRPRTSTTSASKRSMAVRSCHACTGAHLPCPPSRRKPLLTPPMLALQASPRQAPS